MLKHHLGQKFRFATIGAAMLVAASLACAADQAPDRHPWISAPPQLKQPTTYFSNLKDGDRIETPYLLKFGLSRYGLAPIVKAVPNTGHHHLLVNRELPLDFGKPLPFDEHYIHFGKGQMEKVLTFPPGTYTLRLLLADHRHIPYFVYSKPMTITVTKNHPDIDPNSLVKPGVELLAPHAGARLEPPFLVQFHASGLNVGAAEIKDEGVGHFRLVAERAGAAPEPIDFGDGHTEAWLRPPAGAYKLRLELVSNADPSKVMASSAPVDVHVAAAAKH
ncbi:MAG TPA: DUF4399 domain-containing protein [Methylibium sp.]